MGSVRLIRMSRPSTALGVPTLQSVHVMVRVRRFTFTCMATGFGSESDQMVGDAERKPTVVAKAAALVGVGEVVEPKRVDLSTLTVLHLLRAIVLRKLKVVTTPSKPWSLIIQSQIEKVIMDTRFFTLFGVAGTLFGSILCFLKGVLLVMESYVQYFRALCHHSDHGGHIMHLLIESLDMFLIGTAMFTFGMGLHVMFVGSRASKGNGLPIPPSNFFGLFYLKEIPSWAGMESISEAKSKLGQAIMMLLQVGVLEKFKSISLVTGLDLACFAAAIFVSSAGLFILSQLSFGTKT